MWLARRKRAVEWWLQQHTVAPAPVHTFIQPQHYDPNAWTKPVIEEPSGPALNVRAFSTEKASASNKYGKASNPQDTP